ncbi:tetratricopeptide repeat protein [Streptomyces sp. BI20]|uniref:serine/threonine-protein kinase n=1 Tax=Streptomyces sp. BI20 TaxID=3403460 RepID=UPI003C792AF5
MGGGELYCDTCGLAPLPAPNAAGAAELLSPPTGMTSPARVRGEEVHALGGPGSQGSQGSRRARGSQGSQGSQGTRSASSASARSSRSSRSSSSRRSVSGRLSLARSGTTSTRSVSVRGSGTAGSGALSRGRLGAGLVTVPEVPRPDPARAVLANPEVPERKRFCSRSDCGAPVGRSRGDRPGRTEGFCTKCGHPYSFVPKLRTGEIVHGQYEVLGCLAHGGLGWVYLAVDRAVSSRWVVLKGLLDTGDQDAMAAAISERRFLAEIEHANIVRIYNFVEHLDQRTGSLDGYIVMEYVGGKSLKEIANERRREDGRRDPLPVEQACAYGIEALEALGHLHSRNLLYCDFKVDNAIQQQNQLKLIDMGAVRRMDDEDSAIYGTVGYQAPEVAELGPSVASDLYTVARTLAVLTFDFQGYTTVFADSLPDPEHIEVFQRYESFYRLLVRATDPDPGRRFGSAHEMAEQLTGVLREVMALRTGRAHPQLSSLFGAEIRVPDTRLYADDSGSAEVTRLGARPAAPSTSGTLGRLFGRGGERAAGGAIGAAGRTGPAAVPAGSGGPAPAPAAVSAALASVPVPGARTSGEGTGGAAGAVGAVPLVPVGGGAVAPLGSSVTHVTGGPPVSLPMSATGSVPVLRPSPAPAGGGAGSVPVPVSPALPHATPRPDPGPGTRGGALGGGALDPADAALALPVPLVDPTDPNAGFLAGLVASAPAEALAALRADPEVKPSVELRLRELRALLELGDPAAGDTLAELEERFPEDWRVVWARGVAALAGGDDETAALSFDALYDAFPGEPAPKLALGLCAEVLGQLDNAAEYYRLVWLTDPGFVSAAFGLARVRLAAADRTGAVRTLESVPGSSIHFTAARIAAVRARLRDREPTEELGTDLGAAAEQVAELHRFGLDPERHERLTTEVLGAALDWVLSGRRGPSPDRSSLLGSAWDERGLRLGLERSYRVLARLARLGEERIQLVERANRIRPRTWV